MILPSPSIIIADLWIEFRRQVDHLSEPLMFVPRERILA